MASNTRRGKSTLPFSMDAKQFSTTGGTSVTTEAITTRSQAMRRRIPLAEMDSNRHSSTASSVSTTKSTLNPHIFSEDVGATSKLPNKSHRLGSHMVPAFTHKDNKPSAEGKQMEDKNSDVQESKTSSLAQTASSSAQKDMEERHQDGEEAKASVQPSAQASDITLTARAASPRRQHQDAALFDTAATPSHYPSERPTIPDLTLADLERPPNSPNTEQRHNTVERDNGEDDDEEDEPLIRRRRYVSPPPPPRPLLASFETSKATSDFDTSDLTYGDDTEVDQLHEDDDPFGFASAERKVGKARVSRVLALNEQNQQQRRRQRQGLDISSGKQRILDLSLDSPATSTSSANNANSISASSSSSSPLSMVEAARKTLISNMPSSSSSAVAGSSGTSMTTTTRRGTVGRGSRLSQRLASPSATTSRTPPSMPGGANPLSDVDSDTLGETDTPLPPSPPSPRRPLTRATTKAISHAPSSPSIASHAPSKAVDTTLEDDESPQQRQNLKSKQAVEAGKPPTPNRKGLKRYLLSEQVEALLPKPKRRTMATTGRRTHSRTLYEIGVSDEDEVEDEGEATYNRGDEQEFSGQDEEDEETEKEEEDEEYILTRQRRRSTRSSAKRQSKSSRAKQSATRAPSTRTYGKKSAKDKGKGKAKANDEDDVDDHGATRVRDSTATKSRLAPSSTTSRHRHVPKLTAEEQAEEKKTLAERKSYFDEVDQFELDVEYIR
ncbi:hypothetical protein BGW41_003711 [Actinomortierella wolfii]|nr:hypothetical protein BGW41_003711 [Actinomortierella wolfii]